MAPARLGVLAASMCAVAAGKTESLSVHLRSLGMKLLRSARRRRLQARVQVGVVGGSAVSRAVTLRLLASSRRHRR